MPDHIHMLVSIPRKLAVSDFMGYLKGKSTLIIFERYANMKYKYGRRVFWSKGYYVSTVGAKKAIQAYIKNQEAEDVMADQLSFKEFEDPFKNLPELEDDSPEVRLTVKSESKNDTNVRLVSLIMRPFWGAAGMKNGPYGAILHTPRFAWGSDCG